MLVTKKTSVSNTHEMDRKNSNFSPLISAKLPKFPGWLLVLGPGIIWMALAQGSGELIWWPYLIAKYGLGLLFLLIPACLLQYPLNYQIGHYTAMTGESIWQGFVRFNRNFSIGLWILMGISFLWFGAFASAGGTALAALTNFPENWSSKDQSLFWGLLSIAIFFIALRFSRSAYTLIERTMIIVAITTVTGLIIACTHESVLEKIPEFSSALFSPSWPEDRIWDAADTTKLLTAITFAGLGGFWALFYSMWIREKGIGMAGLRKLKKGNVIGWKIIAESKDIRKWKKFLWADAGIGVFGNLFTTLLTCLLAYVVLFPEAILPEKYEIAVVQAKFFELQWGAIGRSLFLLVAAAFLADTWLTTVDAICRVNTDMVHRIFPQSQKWSEKKCYHGFLYGFTVITIVTMFLEEPGRLIQISAVIGFLGTVIFSIIILIINHIYLPIWSNPQARPGRIAGIGLGVASFIYLLLASAYLAIQSELIVF